MDYRTTEVYKFFLVLEQYAFGDLLLLHKLAEDAEAKDSETDKYKLSLPPTTLYPYGFEFNFGKPIHSRAAIPFALMIFSCMDIMGFIVKGGDHTSANMNIREFYTFVSSKPTQDEITCLVNIFRHGLAHNYFPKLGQTISYHSKNPAKLFFPDKLGICLNVNMIEKHFEEGFRNIKANAGSYTKMEKNFKDLNDYYLEHEKCKLQNLF